MYQINKILVPIDFSDYSKNALKFAIDIAEKFQSKLFLVYVIEPMIYPTDFSIGQIAIPAVENDLTLRAEEELKNLVNQEISKRVEAEAIIKSGKPFIEIIETASEIDADLIIIATHGHTGVEHLLFGSTAEKVVRKAPCPVLTVREPLKGFKFTS